jgi:hypothetical protein
MLSILNKDYDVYTSKPMRKGSEIDNHINMAQNIVLYIYDTNCKYSQSNTKLIRKNYERASICGRFN